MSQDAYFETVPGLEDVDPPLSFKERLNLQHSKNRQDLHFWNNHLLTEKEKSIYCIDHNIPVNLIDHLFDSFTDARIWCLRHNLKHREMTDPWRYWLLGELYLQDRAKRGIHYGQADAYRRMELMKEYNLTRSQMENYRRYAEGIRLFFQEDPAVTQRILSGDIVVSLMNMQRLMALPEPRFREFITEMNIRQGRAESADVMQFLGLPSQKKTEPQPPPNTRTIKDMPEYDPDAEVMTLLLTIPSWTGKIKKAEESDLTKVSDDTAQKLFHELLVHRGEIQSLLRALRKEHDGIE